MTRSPPILTLLLLVQASEPGLRQTDSCFSFGPSSLDLQFSVYDCTVEFGVGGIETTLDVVVFWTLFFGGGLA